MVPAGYQSGGRESACGYGKGDLTSLGYRASLAGFVTHTASLDCNTSRRVIPAGFLLCRYRCIYGHRIGVEFIPAKSGKGVGVGLREVDGDH
jgi:hypothetical protein